MASYVPTRLSYIIDIEVVITHFRSTVTGLVMVLCQPEPCRPRVFLSLDLSA